MKLRQVVAGALLAVAPLLSATAAFKNEPY